MYSIIKSLVYLPIIYKLHMLISIVFSANHFWSHRPTPHQHPLPPAETATQNHTFVTSPNPPATPSSSAVDILESYSVSPPPSPSAAPFFFRLHTFHIPFLLTTFQLAITAHAAQERIVCNRAHSSQTLPSSTQHPRAVASSVPNVQSPMCTSVSPR